MKASARIWRETLKLAQAGIGPREWPAELRPTTDGATVESLGFYRRPRKEPKVNAKGQNNGQWKIIGYDLVAVTIMDGVFAIIINGHAAESRGEGDLNFLSNPISEEVYRAVERGEPWPDFTVPNPVRNAKQEADDEHAILAEEEAYNELKAKQPQIDLGERLSALTAEVDRFTKIESDEQSSLARGMQAKFLEIRGEAAGHYEAANRPLLEQQKALREIWFPIRDEADACKTEIGNALGGWEDTKRIAAKRAQEKADREAREHAEATRLAEEANQPPPPPPPVEKANLPPPSAQIKAPGVRAAKVKLQRIVTGIDLDKAFAQFRLAPEVSDVLFALAQRAVTAGLPVDGATIEERSKVSL